MTDSTVFVARNGSKSRQDPAAPGNPLPVTIVGRSDDVTPVVDGTTAGNASNVATIAASATQFAFLTSVIVAGLGATGATAVDLTIAGAEGEDIVVKIPVPAGATVGLTPIKLDFVVPLRGAALGDDITATLGAFGAGNTVATVVAIGYTHTPLS